MRVEHAAARHATPLPAMDLLADNRIVFDVVATPDDVRADQQLAVLRAIGAVG